MKKALIITLITLVTVLYAREIPSKDLKVTVGKDVQFGSVKAKIVRFGGFTTPECKLAVSDDGTYFFFKKVNSTCKTLTNSKGVKIVCNANKSVCKTRNELINIIQNNKSPQGDQTDDTLPSWCNASHLNRTEHTICANDELGKLDKKLASVYGAVKADGKDKTQRAWLKQRNRCKSDVTCIRQAYEERIEQLNSQKEEETLSQAMKNSAFELMKTMCNAGDASICLSVGIIYDEGKQGISVDDGQAAIYYRKACDLGSAKGCAYLGLMYGNGEGVNRDLNTALYYLDKGCAKGHQKACENADAVRDSLKNMFRGARKDACYRISQYGPQRVCLEGTGGDACYGLKDYGLQRVCKEGAGTDACYGLKDYGMQRVCKEGVRSDACYALKDYTMQRSCQNFKGSTTFWLILAHYGYYVN